MARIVQISEAASLALHSMVLIAQAKKSVNATEIAKLTGTSRHHLAKIMHQLVKQGFLSSTRGPSGGFVLKKSASKVNLLDVYECIEGKLEVSGCPLDHPICAFDDCILGDLSNRVTKEIQVYLKGHALSDYYIN